MAFSHSHISAAEAGRRWPELLKKVHQGETFEITENEKVFAKLVPAIEEKKSIKVSELSAFLRTLPPLDPDDRDDFIKDLQAIRKAVPPERNKWED